MTYDLQQLSSTAFQDLAAALAVKVYGPDVQVLGRGRDGGRDMYHHGPLPWRATTESPAEAWRGYTVFQVKQKAVIDALPADNLKWLWGEIRDELSAWANPASNRSPLPDNMVFITNVRLTPTPVTGGHDSLFASICAYIDNLADDSRDVGDGAERAARHRRLSAIQRWGVWDGNQISTLLDAHPGVRRAFNGFFTAADVFAELHNFTNHLPLELLEPALRTHARASLSGEAQIHFDEAGSSDLSGFPLHEVAVDLPILTSEEDVPQRAIGYVLDRAEHVLKPSISTWDGPRHLVLTGSPGNGKTTLSRLLVQTFRCALLDGAEALSVDQRAVIEGTRQAMGRLGRDLPKHRRWSIRVDLAEYAQTNAFDQDASLLNWVAAKVSSQSSEGTIFGRHLYAWLKQWPSLFVLDGLDEVTEPALRKHLIAVVTTFVNEMEAEDCDIFVVVTTRPIGYTEDIAPSHFDRIDLDFLTLDEARRYGELVINTRLHGDHERADRLTTRFREAVGQEALQNLMRTPLQVLILTVILDGAGQLAPDRYSLFWGYYETVYRRERNKVGGLNRLLSDYALQIRKLHERVGFQLQVRSETAERPTATLSAKELRDIVWNLLHEDGFLPNERDSTLLDQIVAAATHRLVLITPRGSEGYGFDVRSLQELSAALHLTSGTDAEIEHRLRSTAASPHWRNTWLFAAGSLFALPRPHQHEAIVTLLETVDHGAEHRLGRIVPVGPRLALDILDDGMARSMPRLRDRIASAALKVLQEPYDSELAGIVRALVRYGDSTTETQAQVADGIRAALGGHAAARETAEKVQSMIRTVASEIAARDRTLGLAYALAVREPRTDISDDPWEDFDLEIETAGVTDSDKKILDRAAKSIRALAESDVAGEGEAAILDALRSSTSASVLNSALEHVAHYESALLRQLRVRVLAPRSREPIGSEIE